MSPQYTVKHDTDWSGNPRTVIRESPTGAEMAGTALGMALVARQKALQRNFSNSIGSFDAAVAKGEFEQALKIAEGLASNSNRDIRGAGDWLRSRALRYLGRPEEAVKAAIAATQALEASSDPDAGTMINYAQCELGWASLMIGNAPTAITAFTRAIKIVPKDEEAFNGRGIALRQLGNFEQSLHDLDQASQINPGEKDHYLQRGLTYLEMNNHACALADFTLATRLAPNSPMGYRYLGQVYLDTGDYDNAISAFTQAIVLDPLHDKTRRTRAAAYRLAGKQAEAEADIAFLERQGGAEAAFELYLKTAKTIVDPLYEGEDSGKLTLLRPSQLRPLSFYQDSILLAIVTLTAWVVFLISVTQNVHPTQFYVSPGGVACVGGIAILLGLAAIAMYKRQHKWMIIWRKALNEITATEARLPGFGKFLKQYLEVRNSGSVYCFNQETRRLFDVGGEAWPYVQNA